MVVPLQRRCEPSYNLHLTSQVGRLQPALLLPTSSRKGSREACKPHTDPTSHITKCEDKEDPSHTAQGDVPHVQMHYNRLLRKREEFFVKFAHGIFWEGKKGEFAPRGEGDGAGVIPRNQSADW